MKTLERVLGICIIIAVMLLCARCAFSQTSGNTPPPPPVCGSTNAGALYTNTGTSPATVYTCSYYNLAWQWVVNPSYGGLVSYPTVPTTCSGSLPVFLAGWPNTQEYVCVNGVPDPIGGAGSGVGTFSAPSGSWPTWLVPTVTNPTTIPSLAVAAGIVPTANGGTGATTAAGANLAITGVTQTGTLGTSSQVSNFPGTVAAPFSNFTQVTAPATAPAIVSVTTGGAVDVGNHWYVVTFTVPMPSSPLNVMTGETDFSPQSAEATTTSGTQTVNLTIPVGPTGVTGRNIYRVDNQPVAFPYYRLVGTVANNTATSFADTVAYASLPSLPNGIQNMPNTTGGWIQSNGLDVGLITTSDTFFGYCSGNFSRSAIDGASFDNTYVGWGAGCQAVQSYNNVAVGVNAMPAPVGGDDNVAVGVHAAQFLYDGQNNTALGFAAGFSNAHGYQNVAVGTETCYLCEGGYNTTIGNYAFHQNVLGNNNIGIGYYAGYNDNLASGDFFLNSFPKADLNHDVNESLLYGHMDNNPANQTLQINAGAGVKIMTGSDWGTLEVGRVASYYGLNGPIGNVTPDEVNGTNGNFSGNINAAAFNTAPISWFGTDNANIGGSLPSASTTGSYNTATGVYSLYFNTTGSNNSAQGGSALQDNTTGNDNTTQGFQALYSNTTGSYNSAQGVYALQSNTTGNYNSAQGYNALQSNTTGNDNTANGVYSLYSNTTGSNNSAQGVNAGRYIADGSTANQTSANSVYLGYGAYALASGDTNENVLGNAAVGNGSNTTTLGNSSVTATYYFGALHGPSARKGTFICTNAGTITISNTNELATSDVIISMNAQGGTITTPPAMKTVTAGTGFTVLCGATDTSTYNYNILD